VNIPSFLARYRQRFERTWSDDTPCHDVRFVVLDSETTGLNPRVDRLITVGAVAEWSAQSGALYRSEGPYLATFSSRGPTIDDRIKPDVPKEIVDAIATALMREPTQRGTAADLSAACARFHRWKVAHAEAIR